MQSSHHMPMLHPADNVEEQEAGAESRYRLRFLLNWRCEMFLGECCALARTQAAPAASSVVLPGFALRPEFTAPIHRCPFYFQGQLPLGGRGRGCYRPQ